MALVVDNRDPVLQAKIGRGLLDQLGGLLHDC